MAKENKGSQPKPKFLVDAETIAKYQVEENFLFSNSQGDFKQATKKGKKYFIKTIPTQDNSLSIENEKRAYTICSQSAVSSLHSVFAEGTNTHMVYKFRPGDHLEFDEEKEPELLPEVIRQFVRFLNGLHTKGLLYLNPNPAESALLTEEGRLSIIGLNTVFKIDEPTISPFNSIDATPSIGTDWLVLGAFCNFLCTGETGITETGVQPQAGPSAEWTEFVMMCCTQSQEQRNAWNPFDHDFLKNITLKVEVKSTGITVDRFYLEWEDGVKVGIGDSYIQVNGDGLTIGSSIDDEEASITIGGDGLTLGSGDYTLNLGANGVTVKEGHEELLVLGSEVNINLPEHSLVCGDSFRLQVGGGELVIGSDGVNNGIPGFKVDMKGGNFTISNGIETVSAGKDGIVWDFEGNGFSIGPSGVRMAVLPFAIELTISPIGLILSFGEASSMSFVVNEGFKIQLGGIETKIDGEGLTLSGEGLNFNLGRGGPKFTNENGPFDFGSLEVSIPELNITIPQLPLPKPPSPPNVGLGMPSVPSVPIPKISFGKRDEDAGKDLHKCLQEGETIEKEEDVIKLGIFAKNKRKLVYTSQDRFFYTDESHTVKGKVYLDKKAKVETKKDQFLKVTGPKGKYNFRFSSSNDRDEWKRLFEEEVSKQ
ncbi:hypothetical protein TRFO_34601 [Tritrichomonas foetus]|uniref:PH domain-containing protein n=1 Tax=Tritrichomonas foetus TaxID=1144522 RepID=A0A1J4JIX5_9EUKA|nr:hypothetical protein TRFO_34601 [Tritrichomonas foetus]|eukprot:OHS99098.1 hypothetical protein TRFO_34601 [Tritrichomonas foetus]